MDEGAHVHRPVVTGLDEAPQEEPSQSPLALGQDRFHRYHPPFQQKSGSLSYRYNKKQSCGMAIVASSHN
jgi:hypothetical protein